ncbi:hypothetical protein F4809DRAFT_654938 [Biscogniauxia mediterranea]|nr:hypothetical protein F4809DRAFT_654938 [Biscogniauxia mediterranea]
MSDGKSTGARGGETRDATASTSTQPSTTDNNTNYSQARNRISAADAARAVAVPLIPGLNAPRNQETRSADSHLANMMRRLNTTSNTSNYPAVSHPSSGVAVLSTPAHTVQDFFFPGHRSQRGLGAIGDSRPGLATGAGGASTAPVAFPYTNDNWEAASYSIPPTPTVEGRRIPPGPPQTSNNEAYLKLLLDVYDAEKERNKQQQQQKQVEEESAASARRIEPALPPTLMPSHLGHQSQPSTYGQGETQLPLVGPPPRIPPSRGNCAVYIYGLSSYTKMKNLFDALHDTGKVYNAVMSLRRPGTAGRDSANFARVEFWTPEGAAACYTRTLRVTTTRARALGGDDEEETRTPSVHFDSQQPASRREPGVRSRVVEVTAFPADADPAALGPWLTDLLRARGGAPFEVVRVALLANLRDGRQRWWWEFCSVPELAVPVFDILFDDSRFFVRYLADPCQP